jgi:hypothetical protein
MRVILAAVVLACSMHAGAAQTCVPAERLMALVRVHPLYQSHHVAHGEEVEAASGIFNAAPPETEIRWTAAVLVSFRDGSGGILVGHGGTICGSLRIAAERWPAIVRAVRGTGV